MPKKTNQLVKESNALARARVMPPSNTIWEARIIAVIAALNRVEDTEFYEQTVDARKLASVPELSTLQYQEVKRTVKALVHKVYEIQTGKTGFIGLPIFQRLEIDDDGVIKALFNSCLKPHYLKLREQFTMRSLPEFQVLTSTYSQQMFRYLSSWKDKIEISVSLLELHETFVVPPSFRKNFKEFRTRVLEIAHREITEKTTLKYEWEPIKRGLRKVVAVRFIFDPEKAAEAEAKRLEAQRENGEMKTFVELQRMSNQCYERLSRLKRICTPKKSEKCDFCTTRGRMYAQKLIEENQTKIPFLNRVAQPS